MIKSQKLREVETEQNIRNFFKSHLSANHNVVEEEFKKLYWCDYYIERSFIIFMRSDKVVESDRIREPFWQCLAVKYSNQQFVVQCHKAVPCWISRSSLYSLPSLLQQLVCVFPGSFRRKTISIIFYYNFILPGVNHSSKSLVSECQCSQTNNGLCCWVVRASA